MSAVQTEHFTLETGAATDTGRVRALNEDAFLVKPEFGVWVVADGMGGHQAGDFASQTIAAELSSIGYGSSPEDLQARFMERLSRAHDRIRAHGDALGGGTVGATLVGLLSYEDRYICIWSGDSRIYRLRDGKLSQQTKDHTEVRELFEAGLISAQEAADWPRKNVITRAIGVTDPSRCDVIEGDLQEGDVFLLCSDGLTEHNSDADIGAALAAGFAPQQVCDMLVEQTLERGAKDNVTVVVMRASPTAFVAPPVDFLEPGA